jgi:phage terminase large subunit
MRYKGVWGGRGSAKSHSIAEALITTSVSRPYRTLCCREIQASIKDSVKLLLDDKIAALGLSDLFESTDTEIRGRKNNSLFVFAGLRSSINSIKSMEGIDRVWVEEAQTVSKASFEKLTPTIRKDRPASAPTDSESTDVMDLQLAERAELWFSWNPTNPSDPVDDFFRGNGPRKPGQNWELHPEAIVRQVNYWDNPWFPSSLRVDMEWDRKRDSDKYEHIWMGGYERNSEARIFKNFREAKPGEFPEPKEGTHFFFGGDWGYAVDPSVLVRTFIEEKTLYIDYEAYAQHCDIAYLPFLFGGTADRQLRGLNVEAWESDGMNRWRDCPGIPGSRDWPIRADSARPETIAHMKSHGFPKMIAAEKGANSVKDGIEFIKSYDVVVHPRCVNTLRELRNYSWKVDPQSGLVLPVPVDKQNHVIDSIRYALEQVRKQKLVFMF